VRAFHAAALAAGYEDHGAPGERVSDDAPVSSSTSTSRSWGGSQGPGTA
jgi:hypothetical protein